MTVHSMCKCSVVMGQLHQMAVLTDKTSAAQISTTFRFTYWYDVQAKI